MSELVAVTVHLNGATATTNVTDEDAQSLATVLRKAWEDGTERGAAIINSADGTGPIAVRLSAVQAVQIESPNPWGAG